MDLIIIGLLLLALLFVWVQIGGTARAIWDRNRAGKGARHRNPGLPRMTRSGTRPRRRADFTQAA